MRQGKRLFSQHRFTLKFVAVTLLGGLAAAASAQVGATFPRLVAKGATYEDVRVLGVSPSTLTVKHRGGLAQIPWRELPPEIQRQFGFDPDAAAANERRLAEESARRAAEQTAPAVASVLRASGPARLAGTAAGRGESAVDRAMARFGSAPEWRRVDLTPRLRELDLTTKDQGRRPSCAVFAVVSALEYQNAEVAGQAEKLSEEYLIWATRQVLGLKADERRLAEGTEDTDAGFTLSEVVAALRSYGIPAAAEMPNARAGGMEKIAAPAAEIVRSARTRRQVFAHALPGRDNDVKVANIVHLLNEGVPVVVGLAWPHWRTLRAPLLAEQKPVPGFFHAVTIVGYYTDTGSADDARFVFKNSWGFDWGNGGYGLVTTGYLRRNLTDGVVLEVRPGAP